MDIQNIDLRRGDFEAMHPTARLLNFDAKKMIYFGDRSESINSQWTTWCACIGMLHLEVKEAQVVPEGFVLVEKSKLMQIIGSVSIIEPITRGNPYMDSVKHELTAITDVVKTVIEAQEPSHE